MANLSPRILSCESRVFLYILDIRFAPTDRLVYPNEQRYLRFPDRTRIVQMALTIEGCRFLSPGLYLLEVLARQPGVRHPTLGTLGEEREVL